MSSGSFHQHQPVRGLKRGGGFNPRDNHGGFPHHDDKNKRFQTSDLQQNSPFNSSRTEMDQDRDMNTHSNVPSQMGDEINPNAKIVLRLIISRGSVEFMFGFDDILVRQLGEQTGARIVVHRTPPPPSTSTFPDDLVTVITADVHTVSKAFGLICRKLWEYTTTHENQQSEGGLVVRLAVPDQQCPFIIGRRGMKINEICDQSGARIQVANVTLPPSSDERCIEVTGPGESCVQAVYMISCVLRDNPLSQPILNPFDPSKLHAPSPFSSSNQSDHGTFGNESTEQVPSWTPVFLCGDQAFIIEGDIARPAPPEVLRRELAHTQLGQMAESWASLQKRNENSSSSNPTNFSHFGHRESGQPFRSTMSTAADNHPSLVDDASSSTPDYMNPLVLMKAISKAKDGGGGSDDRHPNHSHRVTKSMSVESSVAQSIFAPGPQGSKLDEIHRISGATVEFGNDSSMDRFTSNISIHGTEETVLLAQFLIQSQIDMATKHFQKQGLDNFSQQPPQSSSMGMGVHQYNTGFDERAF